jgi:hypothetical protein
MLTIAGGLILGVLGLVVLSGIVRWWTAGGRTVMQGVLVLCVVAAGGAIGLYVLALSIAQRDNARWQASQRSAAATTYPPVTPAEWDAIPGPSPDGIHPGRTHGQWCALWAGTAVPDSLCAPWTVDTSPPALLGAAARTHARHRLADSLAAASEIRVLARDVGATRVEVADILPTWNRWARSHPRADPFGRFQAARLVSEACSLGRPQHGSIDADLRSMSGHTEWCYRSWWADSTIFAASAPRSVVDPHQ